MEITIPAWAVVLLSTFGGGFVGWLIFLTRMAFQTREESKILEQKDSEILRNIERLDKKIDRSIDETASKLDKLENMILNLFGAELQFMKHNIKSYSQGNKPE
jgi:hypothetical protein